PGWPRFCHGWRALGCRRRMRAHCRPEIARGPSRCRCGGGRARPVRRACTRSRAVGVEWRARRRTIITLHHGSEFLFAYPIAIARVALLVLVLSSTAVSAQQPSPAAMGTAKEIVAIKGAKTIYEPLIVGIIEKAKGMFLQTNPMLSKDLNEV